MNFDLARMIRQTRNPRRKQIDVRPIEPTAAMAADLYARVYKPIITAWQQAVERIARSYEGALPLRDQVRDSIFDLDSILSSIGDELQRIVLAITPSLREWAARAEAVHQNRWRGNVLTATGIDLSTILVASGQPQSVGDTIAWNVSLVKSVSDDTRAKISSAVYAAYTARKPVRELASELRDIVGASRTRALGIASDQTKKLAGALDKERMAQAGITKFKYRSSHKKHFRPWHAARDGKVYDLETGKEIGGNDVIKAGDGPAEPPYCGCRRQAVLDLS